jgi:hypothetical protein
VHAFASAARLLIDLYRDRVVAAAAVPSSSYFPCLTIAQIPPNCMAAAAAAVVAERVCQMDESNY